MSINVRFMPHLKADWVFQIEHVKAYWDEIECKFSGADRGVIEKYFMDIEHER